MPVIIDRDIVRNKVARALKDVLDNEKVEELVEVIYDDVYMRLKEEVEERIEKDEAKEEFNLLRSEIKILAETMKMGFERTDKRFEDLIHYIDKRFEDMNKRISILTWIVSLWLSLLSLITVIFKFF